LDKFTPELRSVIKTAIHERLEDAFDALKWWLARRPDSGEAQDDRYWLYKQRGDPEANIPALVVLYTFDDDEVVILSALVMLPDR
jgi:hypothetical protein